MTQQILNTSEAPENFRTLKTDDISKDEMKPGLLFANEEVALNAILKWGELTLCPIMKARRDKTPQYFHHLIFRVKRHSTHTPQNVLHIETI